MLFIEYSLLYDAIVRPCEGTSNLSSAYQVHFLRSRSEEFKDFHQCAQDLLALQSSLDSRRLATPTSSMSTSCAVGV